MYTDLAHAVEDLKEQGFRNLLKDKKTGEDMQSGELPDDLEGTTILQTFRFDKGTDPGDEATVYVLELPDKSRGFLVLSFGVYQDPDKARLIDQLKKLENR
ncbi:MAG: hypothetical protein WEC12_08060 [Balneolaceae bacterium]